MKSLVSQEVPNTHIGSLRLHTKVPSPPFALIVPESITVHSEGIQHSEVVEKHNIVVAVSTNTPNPFMELVGLTLRVVSKLQQTALEDLPDASFKALDITEVLFDTHPEAAELGLITATITVQVTYYGFNPTVVRLRHP